jgi:hypothetical protein
MVIKRRIFYLLALVFAYYIVNSEAETEKPTSSSKWQNPDIGFTLDGLIDMHDAEGAWNSPGFNLRGGELIVSSNIDPYAFLLVNILINVNGVELHEAFSVFPYLPLNLKGKLGLMLANFGRWNRFHVHAMPFTSEPRIYKEYAGGMLALKGVELSWMLPIHHYVDLTLSVYDRIQGHSHDVDPSANTAYKGRTPEDIAFEIGAEKHGSHWHSADGNILEEDDLFALESGSTTNEPEIISGNRRPLGFAYGGKLSTTFEFGSQISCDIGASALYQHQYKKSKRLKTKEISYAKLLYDADVTFFWHPLTSNKYRNLQTGVEMLATYEGFERKEGNMILEEYYNRMGAFSWLAWRQSAHWQFGAFEEFFQSSTMGGEMNNRFGAFLTYNISHYQYLRLEISRYNYPGILDGVNRVQLQYDGTIGFHTHGRQR